MVKETMRTHVVIPRRLVEEVDRLVGQRKRSDFVAAALEEKLMRERQAVALREAAGSLSLDDHPEWSTPENVSDWVRGLREEADAAAVRKLCRGEEV